VAWLTDPRRGGIHITIKQWDTHPSPSLMKLFVGLVVLALAFTTVYGDIINTKVLRSIDLTTQFARHTINITAENKGASSSSYSLIVQNATHLAFIKAETEAGVSIDITEGEVDSNNEYVA